LTATNSRSPRTRATESFRLWLRPAATLPIFLLAHAACGGGDLLLPSAGQPARISIVSGDGQTGTVGQALTDSLVVRVTDPEDRAVPGVEVAFVPAAGATVAPNDTVLTDSDGRAAVHYTLSTTSGDQAVEVRAKPVVPSPSLDTVFHASAEPEPATTLVMASGNEQIGEAGAALPESLAVRAVDRFGNGVAGIEVSWEPSGGSVSPASAVTGADGRSATQRTLGDRPGQYATTASAELEGSPVSFTATGIAPPSPQLILVTQPSATASAGVPFSRQPVLQLQDAAGAPLFQEDVAVTVQIESGGGSLGGSTTVRSDEQGVVTFTDLSIRGGPGQRTLIFAATDFTPAVSAAIDVRAGPPLPGAGSASVPNGTAGATTSITIRLEDAFGTPVEGAAGDISILVEGANPASGLAVTDRGGGQYSASYVPIRTGIDQVAIRVRGTPVPGSPFASTVAPGPSNASQTTAIVTKSGGFFNRVNVEVTVRDAQGNSVARGGDRVRIQVNGLPRGVDPVDHGNGTYTDVFITLTPDPVVAITLNDVPIAGSPYRP
jgi:hypothetical protein